jgi:hypothetical protein
MFEERLRAGENPEASNAPFFLILAPREREFEADPRLSDFDGSFARWKPDDTDAFSDGIH